MRGREGGATISVIERDVRCLGRVGEVWEGGPGPLENSWTEGIDIFVVIGLGYGERVEKADG